MKELQAQKWNKAGFYCNSDKKTQLFFINAAFFNTVENEILNTVSKSEIERASKFFQEKDRAAYLLGRYVLRTVLGNLEKIPPQSIVFSFNANKKPLFKNHGFNITHSADHIYVAFSPGPVGVDAEKINLLFDVQPVIDACFSNNEKETVCMQNSHAVFYTIWTRKEALLKATGEGLCDDMKAIEVSRDKVFRGGKNYFLTSHLHAGYVISTATGMQHNEFVYWDFDPFDF